MTLTYAASGPLHPAERARRVTAILGPTNTGKTHLATERMLQYPTGIIGLPLRLLAREVYNRVVEKVGAERVALITGEEKIKPAHPQYWISTVEAMPRDLDVDFVAVDEIQLAADLDRGHVFTDRLLHRRGREETFLIGASTMEPIIGRLLPGVPVATRPRLSNLTFAGARKLSRLPPRSAIVAFSAEEVYAIAELIRRQRGGAAVVVGALSPRTRNAQVALYQSGDVDFIVATDAIGMGLNLDVDHIAFAGDRKFDGWHHRRLTPAEFGQIAGRAGRHVKDGTFGTTGRCPPFDEELVGLLEQHRFDPIEMLQWRNASLDFSSLESLQASLDRQPDEHGLARAPLAEDVLVLDIAAHDPDVRRQTKTRADIQRLWDVCQVPDYRKLSPAAHADLVLTLFGFVVRAGRIPDTWMHQHLSPCDRTDGDIDTLSARIAQVRTFNYIANRPDWLGDPEHWQGLTRRVEDSLSDALHERLAHRFVDRRTSVLMRRLRENTMLEAEVTGAGDVVVEGEQIGQLQGFRFTPDPQAAGEAARTLNAAAQKALTLEIEGRAARVHVAVDEAFVLSNDGAIRWLGEPIGKIIAGELILQPRVQILADEHLSGPSLQTVQTRLELWLGQYVKKLLGPLFDLTSGEGLEGIARGIGYQVGEALGVLERARVANDTKSLDQNARAALRKFGVRFGAYHLYLPNLLKPAPRALAAHLWMLKHGGVEAVKGIEDVAHLASSGRTSFAADKDVPKGLYLAAGFRVCGERAVRVDILERLADIVRPAIAYRPGLTAGKPPPGAADGDGFVVTVSMTSLAGCSGEAFASILKSLGYTVTKRKGPAITVPLVEAAPTQPLVATPTEAEQATEPAVSEADAAPVDAASEETTGTPTEAASEAPPADAADAPEAEAVTTEAAPEVAPEAVDEPVAEVAVAAAPVESDDPPPESAAIESPQPSPESADTVASDAAAGPGESDATTANAAATDAVPAEEPEIEVWRPGRRPQHEGRRPERHQQRGRGPRPQQRSAPAGEPAPPPAAGEQPVAATGEPAPAQEDRRPNRGRPSNYKGNRSREDDRGPRPPHRHGGGGGGPNRPDRDNRRPDRSFTSSERPARDKKPDPNSPFAKLAALKAELENRAKKE